MLILLLDDDLLDIFDLWDFTSSSFILAQLSVSLAFRFQKFFCIDPIFSLVSVLNGSLRSGLMTAPASPSRFLDLKKSPPSVEEPGLGVNEFLIRLFLLPQVELKLQSRETLAPKPSSPHLFFTYQPSSLFARVILAYSDDVSSLTTGV